LFDSTLQTLNFYSNKDQSDQFIAYLNNFELSENGRINFANIWINLPLYLKNNITIERVFLSLTLDNRVETISKLPLADQTAYLLTANDQIIREYYEKKSFLKNYNLEELDPIKCLDTLTEDIKHILVKIVQLKDKKVFQMQNHPLFRFLISKELQNVTKELLDYPTIIDIQITDPAYQALLCAERCQQFISSDNLLKVLGFVRNNGEIIKLHGEQSKSRPHLRKFKKVIYKIPFDIHYDTNKDDTYIQLGFLGKGTYKTVKQQIKIGLGLPIQAVAKQGLDLKKSVALNELKILEMARGLPHVISFLETSRYFSKKKAKNILSITYPMYNMGELYECMHSTEFSYIKKLELTIEIIKGLMGLHKRNIIHRDIKPENIFLHKSFENGKEVEHAFVGDFGLSCIVFNDPLRLDFSGSKLYMPPAMLEGKEFANCEMDIWALGIVISEFFIGNSPVQKIDIESVLIETTKKLGDLKLNPEPTNKSSIEYVIWKLMQPELFKRMKLAEALFIFEDLLLKEKAHCK